MHASTGGPAANGVTPALLPERGARAMLGDLGRSKLYELTASGDLPTVKIGSRRFWVTDGLRGYVEELAGRQGS